MVKGRRGRNRQNKSLSILFNRIERKQRTLINQTTIKSIYKGGNNSNINESQRGIFLVTINHIKGL